MSISDQLVLYMHAICVYAGFQADPKTHLFASTICILIKLNVSYHTQQAWFKQL
jgi:hypothetical protein